MTGRRNNRDDRVIDYLRQRGEAPMPARLPAEVIDAAARTPQNNDGQRRATWVTPLLAAAAVMLAVVVTLGGLALVDPQIGDDPTPEPSPSSTVPTMSPSVTPRPSASPDPDPSASASPEATDEPTGVEPGQVLVTVTDDLVVRSAPSTASDSEIYSVRLQPGDLLRVTEGPVEGSGFTWYRGAVLDSSAPDGVREGWVAAADQDGTAWLAAVPGEGDGWRLLGESTSGEPYTVGVATSSDDLPALWADAGISEDLPAIDFQREVVVRYTHAVSSTCPDINLEGIGVDPLDDIVYSVVTLPSSPLFEGQTCTSDARPHAFVVAVDRDQLPDGEVHFRLQRGFIACVDCGRESEEVSVVLP